MPRRETRFSIERALAREREKRTALRPDLPREVREEVAREMARQRERLGADQWAEIHVRAVRGRYKIEVRKGRKRRRPGDGSMPALVEPPRGPKPFAGGAVAPLEFD
jgi:hypothetical protein